MWITLSFSKTKENGKTVGKDRLTFLYYDNISIINMAPRRKPSINPSSWPMAKVSRSHSISLSNSSSNSGGSLGRKASCALYPLPLTLPGQDTGVKEMKILNLCLL